MSRYREAVAADAHHVVVAVGRALGKALRDRRKSLRLSQHDLAAKIPHPAFGARDLGRAERGEHDPGEGTWVVWHEVLAKLERASGPAPNPEHQRFIAEFSEMWRAEHKTSGPTWSGASMGRVHADIKAALATHGCDELLRRATNMFASAVGQFPISVASDKDVRTLLGHVDRFVEVRGGPRQPERPPPRGEPGPRRLKSLEECEF